MITSDVYFAAALLSLGYVLEKVDRTEPRHMQFHFGVKQNGDANLGDGLKTIRQAGFDDVKLQWTNKSLVVNAFEFADAIKRMKSTIHSS